MTNRIMNFLFSFWVLVVAVSVLARPPPGDRKAGINSVRDVHNDVRDSSVVAQSPRILEPPSGSNNDDLALRSRAVIPASLPISSPSSKPSSYLTSPLPLLTFMFIAAVCLYMSVHLYKRWRRRRHRGGVELQGVELLPTSMPGSARSASFPELPMAGVGAALELSAWAPKADSPSDDLSADKASISSIAKSPGSIVKPLADSSPIQSPRPLTPIQTPGIKESRLGASRIGKSIRFATHRASSSLSRTFPRSKSSPPRTSVSFSLRTSPSPSVSRRSSFSVPSSPLALPIAHTTSSPPPRTTSNELLVDLSIPPSTGTNPILRSADTYPYGSLIGGAHIWAFDLFDPPSASSSSLVPRSVPHPPPGLNHSPSTPPRSPSPSYSASSASSSTSSLLLAASSPDTSLETTPSRSTFAPPSRVELNDAVTSKPSKADDADASPEGEDEEAENEESDLLTAVDEKADATSAENEDADLLGNMDEQDIAYSPRAPSPLETSSLTPPPLPSHAPLISLTPSPSPTLTRGLGAEQDFGADLEAGTGFGAGAWDDWREYESDEGLEVEQGREAVGEGVVLVDHNLGDEVVEMREAVDVEGGEEIQDAWDLEVGPEVVEKVHEDEDEAGARIEEGEVVIEMQETVEPAELPAVVETQEVILPEAEQVIETQEVVEPAGLPAVVETQEVVLTEAEQVEVPEEQEQQLEVEVVSEEREPEDVLPAAHMEELSADLESSREDIPPVSMPPLNLIETEPPHADLATAEDAAPPPAQLIDLDLDTPLVDFHTTASPSAPTSPHPAHLADAGLGLFNDDSPSLSLTPSPRPRFEAEPEFGAGGGDLIQFDEPFARGESRVGEQGHSLFLVDPVEELLVGEAHPGFGESLVELGESGVGAMDVERSESVLLVEPVERQTLESSVHRPVPNSYLDQLALAPSEDDGRLTSDDEDDEDDDRHDLDHDNDLHAHEPIHEPPHPKSKSDPHPIPLITISASVHEHADPELLPLPISTTTSPRAEKHLKLQTPTPPSSPPPSPSPTRRALPGPRPAWSLRASDAPALGLSAQPSPSSSPSPSLSLSLPSSPNLRFRGKEGEKDKDNSPSASPMMLSPSLPGSFVVSPTAPSPATPVKGAAATSTPKPESPAPSEPASTSTAPKPTRTQLTPNNTSPRPRFPRSPIDIALAMQLRPGLGIGADPAWMVRFLMAMFGWFAILVGGTGEYDQRFLVR